MANEIRTKDVAEAAFTTTTASLAAAAGRSSAAITNSNDQPAALISVKVTSGGSAPTAGGCYTVYLLRDLGTLADDGWGGTDAAFTPVNAPIIGTIVVTNDAATAFYGIFDTAPFGPLGPTFGIAIVNNTDQAISTTEGDHVEYYNYYVPEVQ